MTESKPFQEARQLIASVVVAFHNDDARLRGLVRIEEIITEDKALTAEEKIDLGRVLELQRRHIEKGK